MPTSPKIEALYLDSSTWIFASKTPEGIATLLSTNAGKFWSYFHQSLGGSDSNLSYQPVKAPDGSSVWAYNVGYGPRSEGPGDFLVSKDSGRTWTVTGKTLGPRSVTLAPAGGNDL